MRSTATRRVPVWVVLPIIIMIIISGVVIYHVAQWRAADDMLPAGDQDVQVAPDDMPPGADGAIAGSDGLIAWADAASRGDFATAQQHMEDDHLLYTLWKGHHERFVDSITGYRIVHTETAGQTTTARVQFDTDAGGRCITVQVNEQTQKVRADRVYGTCP